MFHVGLGNRMTDFIHWLVKSELKFDSYLSDQITNGFSKITSIEELRLKNT